MYYLQIKQQKTKKHNNYRAKKKLTCKLAPLDFEFQ